MSDVPEFSRPVEMAKIGAGGSVEKIEAAEHERDALAAALGLVEIVALSAELTLIRDKIGMIRVEGRVRADIVQNCVVSLDPVAQRIDEPIKLRFVRERSDVAPAKAKPPAEIRVDPTHDDPPEVLTGTSIDLGPIVAEHFVLAIDAYPRAPGATLPDNPVETGPDAGESPFAVLAGLGKPRSQGG